MAAFALFIAALASTAAEKQVPMTMPMTMPITMPMTMPMAMPMAASLAIPSPSAPVMPGLPDQTDMVMPPTPAGLPPALPAGLPLFPVGVSPALPPVFPAGLSSGPAVLPGMPAGAVANAGLPAVPLQAMPAASVSPVASVSQPMPGQLIGPIMPEAALPPVPMVSQDVQPQVLATESPGPAPAPAPGVDMPPEATTVRSWAFLKGSMTKIHHEVSQIGVVNDDISSLQSDLKLQEKVWFDAEAKMQQENKDLKNQLAALQATLVAGAGVDHELQSLDALIETEERRSQQLQRQREEDSGKAAVALQFWKNRTAELELHLRALNESAYQELVQEQRKQLHLQSDAIALQLRTHELQGKITDTHKMIGIEKQKGETRTQDLERQLKDMLDGKGRIEAMLAKGAAQQKQEQVQELPLLQQQLKSETMELIRLQQVHGEIAAECTTKTRERHGVLCIERGKASSRNTEEIQFCGPVKMQHSVLQEWISECQGKPLPASSYQGASAPSPAPAPMSPVQGVGVSIMQPTDVQPVPGAFPSGLMPSGVSALGVATTAFLARG